MYNAETAQYRTTNLSPELMAEIARAFDVSKEECEVVLVVKNGGRLLAVGVPEGTRVESWFDERVAWTSLVGKTITATANVDITLLEKNDGSRGVMCCEKVGNESSCWHYTG